MAPRTYGFQDESVRTIAVEEDPIVFDMAVPQSFHISSQPVDLATAWKSLTVQKHLNHTIQIGQVVPVPREMLPVPYVSGRFVELVSAAFDSLRVR